MNNRYICRGKGNPKYNDGEWCYGYLTYDGSDYQIVDSEYGSCKRTVIPETVGQSTGLKDKNGKLIYEGDVVNALFDFEMPIKSVCGFKNGSFGLLAKQHGTEHFHAFTSLCNVKYEVIGNIHDDDLLEVER